MELIDLKKYMKPTREVNYRKYNFIYTKMYGILDKKFTRKNQTEKLVRRKTESTQWKNESLLIKGEGTEREKSTYFIHKDKLMCSVPVMVSLKQSNSYSVLLILNTSDINDYEVIKIHF